MALDLCFWDKACIRRREEAQAAANAQIAQQQQVLLDITSKPSGGLKAWAIAAIIGTALLIAGFIVYRIKAKKK